MSHTGRLLNRAELIDQQFINSIENISINCATNKDRLNQSVFSELDCIEVLESVIKSRQLDLLARRLRSENKVFYTIGSSGHEANALVGRLSRYTDPAFVHYRSGGFMAERSRKLPGIDFIRDTALSLAASADDPISGGRHKVFGSKPLWVLPQTSTIASHLPKAVGCALAISQAHLFQHTLPVPEDSIVICSFGDASVNHSTAQGAFNTAQWAHYQGLNVPVLFICEDNDWGLSVKSPQGWVKHRLLQSTEIKYFYADGLDILLAATSVSNAINYCREHRAPVFLHLKTCRLMGHAGTDIEMDYRDENDLTQTEKNDPLITLARQIIEMGLLSADQVLAQYLRINEACLNAINEAAKTPKLKTAREITQPLAPHNEKKVMFDAQCFENQLQRIEHYKDSVSLPENMPPRHMAILINYALRDLMLKYPQSLLFGEDVAQKGGVYTITKNLMKHFHHHRVFNTLLDEQSILGLAQGYANMGFLPLPEIQYLAFFHNAADQVRGEAASLQFFSNNQFANPMVLRLPGLGYQKGFGGHFHNDNSLAALRDIPGIVIACPSRGDDAVMLLRTLMAMAKTDGRVCIFIEPIALYMRKHLYEESDNKWLFKYSSPERAIRPGQGRVYQADALDCLIISYANGVLLSLQALKIIEEQTGKSIRVLDLRWLCPLNKTQILQHANACKAVLVVDECRHTGATGHQVISCIEQQMHTKRVALISGQDSYTPLGDAANAILPRVEDIVECVGELLKA